MDYAEFSLNVLQNISLVLLFIFFVPPRLYFLLRRRSPLLVNLSMGLLLGVVGCVNLLVPAHIAPGVTIDSRFVVIVMAVMFGGWTSGLLTTLMICAFCIWIGGPVMGLGLVTALGSLAAGGLFYQAVPWLKRQGLPVYLLLGGVVMLVTAAWIALVPLPAADYRLQVALPVGLLYGLFAYALGSLVAGEMKHAREVEHSEQLARAVRITRECDQALIKAGDENTLLEQICEIIVRNSAYLMVWVGYPEEDEALSVRSAASAGRRKDYVSQVNFSWGDNPLGRGPVGRAVRNRHFALCTNTSRDPDFAPWRDEARERGFASALALPLLHKEDLLGVLTLYASSSYAFDPAEILLLQDLADDLAYGMAGLRLRAEKARVQSALDQSERQLASILRAAPEAIFISTRAEGRILAVNDGFERITGFKPEEVIGFTLFDKKMWFDPAGRAHMLAELQLKGLLVNYEILLCKKNGQVIPLLTQVMPVLYMDQECLLFMGSDISEMKIAQEALRLSDATFRLLINSTDDTVLLIDLEGHVLEVNDAMAAQLGVTRQKLLGSIVYDYFPREMARARREKVQEAVGLQHSVRFEDQGSGGWEEQIISPVYNSRGEVISFAVVARNINERKKAEDKLRRSEEDYRALATTLEQRVGERTRELEILYKISASSSTANTIEEVMDHSLKLAVEGMGLLEGAIYLLVDARDPDSLNLAAYYGLQNDNNQGRFPDDCLIRQVVQRRQAILRADISKEYPCNQCCVHMDQHAHEPRSFLGLPMHARDTIIGVLNVFGLPGQSYTVEEIALVETVADQIAVSIENARLRQHMEAAAIKEERARLGRELHDSVTQEIYSLMLFSETARRASYDGKVEQSRHLLDRIFDISHQALKEMRLMVYDLHPAALEQAGLVEALQGRLDAVEKRAGIEIVFETRGNLENLSAPLQQELYRVAIEALNNATKHAHASHIGVNVFLDQDVVELIVTDDGCGFDLKEAAENGGLGIRSMQERSARYKGHLSIKTRPGQGTEIHVWVPLFTPAAPVRNENV